MFTSKVRSIAPSGWRCSNEVLRYCTVRLTELEWRFALLHRQAASGALTADGWGTLPLSDGWSNPPPFWRLGVPPFQAARGAVTTDGWASLHSLQLTVTLPLSDGWVYQPSGRKGRCDGLLLPPFIMFYFKYFHVPCIACCIWIFFGLL
jgi:hypothetical protein